MVDTAKSGPESQFANATIAALITLKKDGRPQISNVSYHYDRDGGVFEISTTADRAKTANARRDPRVSLYVPASDGWGFAVADGRAELTATAADPHDDTVEQLVALYRKISGEHPDWDEYRAAMVSDKRLVLRVHVERITGQPSR